MKKHNLLFKIGALRPRSFGLSTLLYLTTHFQTEIQPIPTKSRNRLGGVWKAIT